MIEWLSPYTGAIAAGVALPALVAMYFLKLRRHQVAVSSTLLWKRAVQDLQVNAPFQRLRKSLLLLLQLLALAAVLTALAGPVLSLQTGPGRRYVLLIDRSASMNATDADGRTRLAAAKDQAQKLIDSLRGPALLDLGDPGDEAMVIAFDRHPAVLCNFTAEKARLAAAIEGIEPTDGASSLAEALAIARAFAESQGAVEGNRAAPRPPELHLFSDGRIADLSGISAGATELKFHRLGGSADNVAVTALQARRSYEKPDEVHVFAGLSNFGPAAAACDVQLSIDGQVRSVRRQQVPPARPASKDRPAASGGVSVSFVLTHSGGGVVSVRQLRRDPLASDDAAWTILPPPKKLHVLLVTSDNPAIEAALRACPLERLDAIAPAQFDERTAADPGALSTYDVVVLDGHAPANLPRGRYIVFGSPPPDIDATAAGPLKGEVLVDWRARHPVLEFVGLSNLYAAEAVRMRLPKDAELLAEFGASPAIALLRRRASTFLLVGFDVMQTNWPFEPGFVIFCYNATTFLGQEDPGRTTAMLNVGEAIAVRSGSQSTATLTTPDGRSETLTADGSGTFRYPRTHRVGVYRLAVPDRPETAYAVNILDEFESNIAPADKIALSSETVEAQPAEPRRTNVPLWPWLAGAAFVLVCLEWFVYNSKVRL